MKVFRTRTHPRRQCMVAAGVHVRVAMRPPPLKQPAYAILLRHLPSLKLRHDKKLRRTSGYGAVNKGKQSMKSKLIAFLKEAIRAAVAAVAGVAGAAHPAMRPPAAN